MQASNDKVAVIEPEQPVQHETLHYPLRPRAKGVYPKKSSLLPPSSSLGMYSLGAVIPPAHW